MFSVGDMVCYPMHGVGTIQTIEEKTILGDTATYYTIRFVSNSMTAMVPVDNVAQVGLRRVIEADECGRVLEYLDGDSMAESDNWNQRYRDNMEKLKRGSIYEIADVVRSLKKRDNEKGLSSVERKMLLSAKNVLVTELSYASGKDAADVEASVESVCGKRA
ncbi:MAG: CarD family transcriptional regulator [Clostridia bacterium]|nr:CarD family transcriptional regulator [Clostridia bacterium]